MIGDASPPLAVPRTGNPTISCASSTKHQALNLVSKVWEELRFSPRALPKQPLFPNKNEKLGA